MHLLSFIGAGKYQPTTYQLDGADAPLTKYPQIALAKLLEDCSEVTVFETEQARKVHHEPLKSEAEIHGLGIGFVPIPSGVSEPEQWEIFTAIEEAASRHKEVVLDITHGFRTLPVLGVLSAIFLQVTGKVSLSRLLYGAYEAREMNTDVTPVFDLTPFLVLVDWLTASHVFLKTGNATELSGLLKTRHRDLWTQGKLPKENLPRSLGKMGSALETAADSLLLLRRHQREEAIAAFQLQMENARTEIPEFAKPFGAILTAVAETFSEVVAETPLETERRQIRWLVERGHSDAALTLAREWMVSWTALQFGEASIPIGYETRKEFEKLLNVLGGHEHVTTEDLRQDLKLATVTETWTAVGKLWDKLRRARNDLNHAGYGHDPAEAGALRQKAAHLVGEVMALGCLSGDEIEGEGSTTP